MILLIIFLIISSIIFAISISHWSNRHILASIPLSIIENIKLDIKNNKYTNLGSIIDIQLFFISYDGKIEIQVENGFGFDFLVKNDDGNHLLSIDLIKKDNNWVSNYKRYEYISSKEGNILYFLFSKYVTNTFFGLVLPLKLMKLICIISGLCTVSIGIITYKYLGII